MMSEQESKQKVPLRIDYHIPEDFPNRYATHMVVQHTEHEFILSFFEVYPPPLLRPTEQQISALKKRGTVKAACVGRITVAASRMREFVKALEKNLEQFESTPQAAGSEVEE